jgi:hypothetical protein
MEDDMGGLGDHENEIHNISFSLSIPKEKAKVQSQKKKRRQKLKFQFQAIVRFNGLSCIQHGLR